ncbi:hypothetical protein KAH94_01490 [bacterium]|nr:hypothetical protein [bacterium]
MSQDSLSQKTNPAQIFSGNIYIFHAFDVGHEIDLKKIKNNKSLIFQSLRMPKYFKNYHTPLAIDLPHPHTSGKCKSCKIHNFGPISLTYKVPFKSTLEDLRIELLDIENEFQEESVANANSVFKKIKNNISRPKFFQTRSSYVVIQIDQIPKTLSVETFKKEYGGIISSMLRLETETLSEYQKNEILQGSMGYFRGDMIVVDTEAAFVYDDEHEEILDLFEFANIQSLELRYFDRLLDRQITLIYEEKYEKLPLTYYLPFVRSPWRGPVGDLGKLRAEISVISERLENSIKLEGETYFSELYGLLTDKLDLKNWKEAINRKLAIIGDIRSVYQHKIDAVREDILTILIIALIFIELLVALFK